MVGLVGTYTKFFLELGETLTKYYGMTLRPLSDFLFSDFFVKLGNLRVRNVTGADVRKKSFFNSNDL